jgi:hypothetical protein
MEQGLVRRVLAGAAGRPEREKSHSPQPEYFAKEFALATAVVSRMDELASTLTNVSARPTKRLIFFLAQATYTYSRLKRSINHLLQR